ncbi:uncharacterized protein LOC141678112 [Apium graveolens]|uniref:uncharacterized protein LOC141678112 n=1 Tax=Apium graveolens TaxID=4045 RepID=UPI003D7B4D16
MFIINAGPVFWFAWKIICKNYMDPATQSKIKRCSCPSSHFNNRSKSPERFTSIRIPEIHNSWHYMCSLHSLANNWNFGGQNRGEIEFGACRSMVPVHSFTSVCSPTCYENGYDDCSYLVKVKPNVLL